MKVMSASVANMLCICTVKFTCLIDLFPMQYEQMVSIYSNHLLIFDDTYILPVKLSVQEFVCCASFFL